MSSQQKYRFKFLEKTWIQFSFVTFYVLPLNTQNGYFSSPRQSLQSYVNLPVTYMVRKRVIGL